MTAKEQQAEVAELLEEAEDLWCVDPFDVRVTDWKALMLKAYKLGQKHAQTAG